MALAAVLAAVSGRLAAEWTRCPVRGPNAKSRNTPAADEPFVEVQYPVMTASRISIGAPGANRYRDEGAIRLVLNVVRGKGIDEAAAWIDELRALFRGKSFDGVCTFAPSPPVIDDRNDDGRYYLLSFAVPFEHDYFG
ncbi:phage tail terminator-like protein [Methylobacterium sp. NEAU 140]|uniref:phage tail terminator-like protein n=1 Tax=Methylobacterium sp. NEAU 140 TaxID=3064945 RepID=UPI00273411C3|nr:phage tail terminator-like protein [Methylobacterium sp. NEAU 140]MDP4024458.1 phage tail terminator-like protein [Methylobacterium sp. NEAU 140]